MRISRNSFAFVSMLAAGLLLAGATVLVPSTRTFGQETDYRALAEAERLYEQQQKQQQPAAQPPAQAPAPPAAPIDAPAASSPDSAGAGSTEAPSGLPSAGNGGYLNRTQNASLGYMLMGLGATLIGSGSLVWAFSRRSR